MEFDIRFCFTVSNNTKASVNRESFWQKHNATEALAWIVEKTSFLSEDSNVTRRLYHLRNSLYKIPLCKTCNSLVEWKNNTYATFCSRKCSANDTNAKKIRSNNMTKLNNNNIAMELRKASCDAFRQSDRFLPYCNAKSKQAKEQHASGSLGSNCLQSYFSGDFIGSDDQKSRSERLTQYNIAHKDELSNKRKSTLLDRYGVENYAMTDEFKDKINCISMEKYGVPHHNQRHFTQDGYNKLTDGKFVIKFLETSTMQALSDFIGIDKRTIQRYYPGLAKSEFEKEVSAFIRSQLPDAELVLNTRKVIAPYELDIYLPEYNIGVECNGSYWHAENQGRKKQYHLNKLKSAQAQGIQLIQIWEHDWNSICSIVKGRIQTKLGISKRIYGRHTEVKPIDSASAKMFLERNHIQGNSSASIRYGLFEKKTDNLVAVMTFGKSRFNKSCEWELIRYCSLVNVAVVGGASKLFKHFQKQHSGSVISYSCKMWNTGNLYEKLGFEHSHTSSPNYYYTTDYRKFESRLKYQKHKLSTILNVYSDKLSEWENMKNNGFDRIWDCGNDAWIYHAS